MVSKLTATNFFCYYIFNPQAPELSPRDRRIATLATIAFGVLLLGSVHLAARCFYNKSFKIIMPPFAIPKVLRTALPPATPAPKKPKKPKKAKPQPVSLPQSSKESAHDSATADPALPPATPDKVEKPALPPSEVVPQAASQPSAAGVKVPEKPQAHAPRQVIGFEHAF